MGKLSAYQKGLKRFLKQKLENSRSKKQDQSMGESVWALIQQWQLPH